MPVLDNGEEALSVRSPLTLLLGLMLLPAAAAQSAASLSVALSPGTAIIHDHPHYFAGDDSIVINSGNTLTDLSEVYADVVIFWNEKIRKARIIVVNGAEALTATGAEPPTDAEVEAAITLSTYRWVRAGRVKFSRSGTAITMELDHTVRPLGVEQEVKDGTATGAHETAIPDSPALYVFSHTEAISVDAADIANGDILTNKPVPGFYGKIDGIRAVVEKAVTTAAKLSDINAEIGTTNLTGGVVSLTSAAATPLGKVIAGSAITAGNTFKPGDTYSLEAANTTAFVEGRFRIEVDFYRLVTPLS